ncbi:hypothetical protein HN587_00555 [Candidatus Woesearchaeota archaeon]|jgi:hypothetical protein|nr:hypothetical protein [Candidatus Woesearchaeota archaeon]
MYKKLVLKSGTEIDRVSSFVVQLVDDSLNISNPFEYRDRTLRQISAAKLSSDSKEYLHNLVGRVVRARALIKLLENKYGIKQSNESSPLGAETLIAKPEGLYKELRRYIPQEGLEIITHNVLVGIRVPDYQRRNDEKGTLGIARGIVIDPLQFDLTRTARRIERDLKTNFMAMSYVMPTYEKFLKIQEPHEKDKLLAALFGAPMIEDTYLQDQYLSIQRHEMRHVIDLLLYHRSQFTETAADLFADRTPKNGFKRDLEREVKRIESHAKIFFSDASEEKEEKKAKIDKLNDLWARTKAAYEQTDSLENRTLKISYLLSVVPEHHIPEVLTKLSQI